jgi:hypothetical protein
LHREEDGKFRKSYHANWTIKEYKVVHVFIPHNEWSNYYYKLEPMVEEGDSEQRKSAIRHRRWKRDELQVIYRVPRPKDHKEFHAGKQKEKDKKKEDTDVVPPVASTSSSTEQVPYKVPLPEPIAQVIKMPDTEEDKRGLFKYLVPDAKSRHMFQAGLLNSVWQHRLKDLVMEFNYLYSELPPAYKESLEQGENGLVLPENWDKVFSEKIEEAENGNNNN